MSKAEGAGAGLFDVRSETTIIALRASDHSESWMLPANASASVVLWSVIQVLFLFQLSIIPSLGSSTSISPSSLDLYMLLSD